MGRSCSIFYLYARGSARGNTAAGRWQPYVVYIPTPGAAARDEGVDGACLDEYARHGGEGAARENTLPGGPAVSKSEDYRAMALECDDRARTSPRYETRVQYEESAKQLRALAERLERLDAEQAQSSTLYLRSRQPHGRFP
jgi:hypothetical protein